MRVLVVGGGVSGLSCAVVLLEAGVDVEVVTAAAPMGTVSAIAGAMLGPIIPTGGPADAWEPPSDRRFRELATDETTGVRLIRGRLLSAPDVGPGMPPWASAVPGYRACEPTELPDGYPGGFWVELPFAEMPRYLPWLVARVDALGGTVRQEIVLDLAAAGRAHGADLVVNASGLGAATLARDEGMSPIWGQHVLLDAPYVDTFLYEGGGSGDGVAITPHRRGVQIGSVRRPGRSDLAPDVELARAMVRRAARVDPRLADAPVLGVEAGLRPGRERVRLEREEIDGVPVVHDYGHAGSGVFWSWGCARAVADLVGG